MEDISHALQILMNQKDLNVRYRKLMLDVYHDPDVELFLHNNEKELSKSAFEKGASKLYEYCQEKKKIARHEESQVPGYMPVLVVSNHLIDIEYKPTRELLEEQADLRLHRRVKSINMPKVIKGASFKDFKQDDGRAVALLAAVQFTKDFRSNPKSFHRGVYLSGQFGVGKTFLLGAMANRLAAQGFQTTMIHFPSFAVEMKQSIGNNTTGEKINSIKRAPVLMIDDIGADASSSWIRDDVLGVILEFRMQEELPTCFTSNFSMDELEKGYLTMSQRGDEEPIKAQRIMQRIRYLSKEIPMIGRNRRLNPTD